MNSREKRRYVQDGFDLDLAYITDRIIAMGYPSSGVESLIRNNMKDVQRFLRTKYPGHHKVYNLCCERKYNDDAFDNVSREFIFDDHNAPQFSLMRAFWADLDEWFKENPDNIACIRCKAGKGRTGVMIWAYLLYSGQFKYADDALAFYSYARTHNKKGVTIPSQIRYVNYFAQTWKPGWSDEKVVLKLNKIRMLTIPKVNYWYFIIKNNHKDKKAKHYDSSKEIKTTYLKGKNFYDFNITSDLYLIDDVKVEFYGKKKLFHFWFHTSFIDKSGVLVLPKDQIDKADRDKKCKIFDKNFWLELYFDFVDKYVMSDLNKPEKKYNQQEQFLLKKVKKLPKLFKQLTL